LSSESGSFTSEDPSESSENVGGHTELYSGELGSSSHLDSTEASRKLKLLTLVRVLIEAQRK
jgi:hypothetical protein